MTKRIRKLRLAACAMLLLGGLMASAANARAQDKPATDSAAKTGKMIIR